VSSPEVTVAVVSWNTRELLAACLESLRGDVEAGRAAVWVVDNGSEDGSPEMVAERFGWAELVRAEENLGFGRAVNLVAERTTSEWIAPANADIALEPDALATLLAAGRVHTIAGALAPRLLAPDGSTQHSVHAFPTVAHALAFNLGAGRALPSLGERLALPGRWDPEREREVDWAVGAFLLVRRLAWDQAGGFDPEQWLYAEDLDLGWRLHEAGWYTRYVPAARVLHDESAAARQAFGDDLPARWLPATYEWIARRRGTRAARTIGAVNATGASARAAALALGARLWPERYGWRHEHARRWARAHRDSNR
jgi:N-acetylglucosaminyl-diphospho-decaprenol L-rhamnosyltransferase